LRGFLEQEEVVDGSNGFGLQVEQNHFLVGQVEDGEFSIAEHAELVERVMEGHFPDDDSLVVDVHDGLGKAWFCDFQVDDRIVVGCGELQYLEGGSFEVEALLFAKDHKLCDIKVKEI
jgi:hypothetical protein